MKKLYPQEVWPPPRIHKAEHRKRAQVRLHQKPVLEFDKPTSRGMNWTQVRTWSGEPTTIPVKLNKGRNELLFKVASFTPWGDPSEFGCQVLDKEPRLGDQHPERTP